MKYKEEQPLEESNITDFGMGKCSYQNCCKFASKTIGESFNICEYHWHKIKGKDSYEIINKKDDKF